MSACPLCRRWNVGDGVGGGGAWECGGRHFKIGSLRDLYPQLWTVRNQFLHLDLKEYFHAIVTIRITLKSSPPNCELPVFFDFCVSSVEAGA